MSPRPPARTTTRACRAAALACAALATVAAPAPAADGRTDPPHAARTAVRTLSAAEDAATPSAPATDEAKGTGFAIPRHVIAGGGGSSSGGAFAVSGTIGQFDADPLHPATGGVFAISGGFWPGLAPGAPQPDPIFANGFESPPP